MDAVNDVNASRDEFVFLSEGPGQLSAAAPELLRRFKTYLGGGRNMRVSASDRGYIAVDASTIRIAADPDAAMTMDAAVAELSSQGILNTLMLGESVVVGRIIKLADGTITRKWSNRVRHMDVTIRIELGKLVYVMITLDPLDGAHKFV